LVIEIKLKKKAIKVQDDFDEFIQYCRSLIDKWSKLPPINNFISTIMHSKDKKSSTFREHTDLFVFHLIDLIFAGHANLVNMLGTGIAHLLLPENKEELEKLKKDPDIIQPAIEELLRFTTPTQMLGRIAAQTCPIGHTPIPKDETVGVCIFQANRDPKRFPQPHKIILDRTNGNHLAFGGGIHICVGRHLARLEAKIAIPILFQTFPNLRLVEYKNVKDLPFNDNFTFQALKSVLVAF